MSTTKTWTKLTSSLSEVLQATLSKADCDKVLKAWEGKKDTVSSVLKPVSSKASKDPNAPKKALSNYILFCGENREAVKAENPNLEAKEVTRELGARWRALSDEEKAVYSERATQDKVRYEAEMQGYVAPEKDDTKEAEKPKKTRKPSAYMNYCKAMRDVTKIENPTVAPKDITGLLSAKWKEMSVDEKAGYTEGGVVASKPVVHVAKPALASKTTIVEKNTPVPKPASKPVPAETKEIKVNGRTVVRTGTKHQPTVSKPVPPVKTKASNNTPGAQCFIKEKMEELEAQEPKTKKESLRSRAIQEWESLSKADRELYEEEARVCQEDDEDIGGLEDE